MAAHPAPATVDPERDPIADARALVAMAIGLGQRTRTAHRLGLVTDRKAALYVSTLVRHASRLLQSASSHDVPVLRSSSTGPGGNAVHYVVRHDRLIGPPSANRFLVVGSDARLRCCIVADHGGARIWADYDVPTAPDGLSLRVVLDALSEIIARLEQTVIQLETRELVREAQLEADIAAAKARIAGLPVDAPVVSRRHARSEEPVRPWTRHVAPSEQASEQPSDAAAPAAQAAPAAPVAEGPSLPPEIAKWARPVASESTDDLVFSAVPEALHDDAQLQAVPSRTEHEPDVHAAVDPASTEVKAARRGFSLSRLHKAI